MRDYVVTRGGSNDFTRVPGFETPKLHASRVFPALFHYGFSWGRQFATADYFNPNVGD